MLAFKKSPDFEMPGDRNDDNLYEVTVRASDGTMTADRMVVVKVTNVVEDGKVALSPEEAVLGVELTATLTDPEGSVSASGQITGERWTWLSGTDADSMLNNDAIEDETSPTYTPVRTGADGDLGMYLSGDGDLRPTRVVPRRLVCRMRLKYRRVADNQAPRFMAGTSTFRVVAEERCSAYHR